MPHRLSTLIAGLLLCSFLHAGKEPLILTAKQTRHIIDSILHSDLRVTERLYYNDTFLFRERIYIDRNGLSVHRYHYPTGQRRSEGLYDYKDDKYDDVNDLQAPERYNDARVGLWSYFSPDGTLYKECNFGTMRQEVFDRRKNAGAWVFDTIHARAKRFFISRFGFEFTRDHVRFDRWIRWNTKCKHSETSNNPWGCSCESFYFMLYSPEVPSQPVDTYDFYVRFVFEDTIVVYEEKLEFNEKLELVKIGWDEQIDGPPVTCFKVGYREALDIATKAGYPESLRLSWYPRAGYLKWYASSASKKTTSIDVCTGKIPEHQLASLEADMLQRIRMCDASVFTTPCPDTMRLRPGWKTVQLGDLLLNMPAGWLRYDIYHGWNLKKRIYTNGVDTINVETGCYGWAYLKRIHEEHYNDHGAAASRDSFLAAFPGSKLQGREVDIGVDWYKEKFNMHIDFKEKNWNYQFTMYPRTAERRDELLAIFRTARFVTN